MKKGAFRFPMIKVEGGIPPGYIDTTDPEALYNACVITGGYIPDPTIYIPPVIAPESSTDSIIYIVNGSCGTWYSQSANTTRVGTNPLRFQVFDKDLNELYDNEITGDAEFAFPSATEFYSVKISATGGDYFTRVFSSAGSTSPRFGIEGCIVNAPLLNSLQGAFQYNYNFKWILFNSTLVNVTTMYGAFQYTNLLKFEFIEDEYPNLIDISFAFIGCKLFTSNPFRATQLFPVLEKMENAFNTTGVNRFTFPLSLPSMLSFLQVCSGCSSLQVVDMFTYAPLATNIGSMFNGCDIRHPLIFPEMPAATGASYIVNNNNQLPKIKFQGDYDSLTGIQSSFANAYLLKEIEYPRKISGSSATTPYSSNTSLQKIILPDIITATNPTIPFYFIGSLIESIGDCDNSAALDANQADISVPNIAAIATVNHPKLRCKRVQVGGTSIAQKNPNITTFIIDWANSKYLYATAPQIRINAIFNAAWLDAMMTALPTVSAGQVADLGNSNGYKDCDHTIANAKGWTVRGFAKIGNGSMSPIGRTTATFNGQMDYLGGYTPVTAGVCFRTTPGPTAANNPRNVSVTAEGAFSVNITSGLAANTTYYARAYATSTYGTVYGDEFTFTTLP